MEPIILDLNTEFLIEDETQEFEYKVERVHPTAKDENEDEDTIPVKKKTFGKQATIPIEHSKNFIIIKGSDGSELKINSDLSDDYCESRLNGFVEFINGKFCLNNVKINGCCRYVWYLISVGQVFKLISETVIRIIDKRFQVVYKL